MNKSNILLILAVSLSVFTLYSCADVSGMDVEFRYDTELIGKVWYREYVGFMQEAPTTARKTYSIDCTGVRYDYRLYESDGTEYVERYDFIWWTSDSMLYEVYEEGIPMEVGMTQGGCYPYSIDGDTLTVEYGGYRGTILHTAY